ncbi:MAG: thioredoxin, partial [Clostridia bacterium]|nr:thioredoxin [Clostridia bacterium]
PCKMLSPIIAEIAEEYNDKVKVGKVNVDEQRNLAIKYQISSIPTLILFKNGQVKNMIVGFQSKSQIVKMLEG